MQQMTEVSQVTKRKKKSAQENGVVESKCQQASLNSNYSQKRER